MPSEGASEGYDTTVRFDDRLMTVLNQPAGDRHDSAVRWRQLVDLVARAGPNSASPAVGQALAAIGEEAPGVDEPLRAAAARAVAALPLPLGLLQYFAADRLAVSAPVLAAATLDPGQWRAVHDIADAETRRFIEALHPEIKPAPARAPGDTMFEQTVAAARASSPSLHDVVARIERRRQRGRQAAPNGGSQPPAGAPALFRWECGPSGEIAWVDGAPRGALVGRSIARSLEGDGNQVDGDVVRAFARRAPFRDAVLTVGGDGLVSGEWKISGVPAFEPGDGRFAGYRGVAMRETAPAEAAAPGVAADLLADPDALRELVHEIKTPLNAIIGFAEIIEGQYLGPADRRYRERAMEIVGQARLLLMAIDDLDFAAKIHSAGTGEAPRVDLGKLAERLAPSLREHAQRREVGLEASRTMRDASAALEPELADRLIFRMCRAVIDRAQKGERLRLAVDQTGGHCRLSISLPAELQELGDEGLFGGGDDVLAAGFCLRLARGLARIAGGEITRINGSIALVLPSA
jgi:hypothetical protein